MEERTTANATLRRMRQQDLPAVAQLLRQTLEWDPLPDEWIRHKIYDDPDFEPAMTLVAEDADGIAAYGQAVVRDGANGCIKMVAVAPRRQRQRLGTLLMDELERLLGARVPAATALYARPSYFTPGLDPRYTPAAAMLLTRGYQRTGDGFNMGLPLSGGGQFGEVLRAWDACGGAAGRGLEILRPGLEQEARVREWLGTTGVSAAWTFQAMRGFDLAARDAGKQSGLLIAARGGVWVGFAVYDGVQPGWFGPEWVHPSLRGTGIGKALLIEALRAMRDDGYQYAEIGLVGPLPFYAKCVGARVSRTWWFFRKQLQA